MWGRSPGAKSCLGTFTAGLQTLGRSGKTTLATLALSSAPARSHKIVSKGPALVRLGGQGTRVGVTRSEMPPGLQGYSDEEAPEAGA